MNVLFGGGYDRSHLTAMVLAELGAPFRFEHVDTRAGAHRSPEFLRINPAGFVPALRTPEGEILYETPAINLYLCERYGPAPLAPDIGDPDRGAFLCALFYIADELEPALKRYFFPHRYAVRAADEAAVQDMAFEAVKTCLRVINDGLSAKGPFHLGARYSLPDLVLSFWMSSTLRQREISEFAAINHCVAEVRARPAIAQMFDDHDARMAEYFVHVAAGRGVR